MHKVVMTYKHYDFLTCIHEFCNLLLQVLILDCTQQSHSDRKMIHDQHVSHPGYLPPFLFRGVLSGSRKLVRYLNRCYSQFSITGKEMVSFLEGVGAKKSQS